MWHVDCGRNVYSKVTNGLWMVINLVSVIFKSIKITSTKFNTKTLFLTFFFFFGPPQRSLKTLQLNKIKKRGMSLTIITGHSSWILALTQKCWTHWHLALHYALGAMPKLSWQLSSFKRLSPLSPVARRNSLSTSQLENHVFCSLIR